MTAEVYMRFQGMEGYKAIRRSVSEYIKQVIPSHHFMMEVAVNEAVLNSIRHGSKEPSKGRITLSMRVMNGKKLIIRVKDEGPGFSANERLNQMAHWDHSHLDEMVWKESGRGLFIMKQAADFMTYNQKGNEVLMVKNIAAQECMKEDPKSHNHVFAVSSK